MTLTSYKGSVMSDTAYAYTQYQIGADGEWQNFPNTTEDAVTIQVPDGTALNFKMRQSPGEPGNMILTADGTEIGTLPLMGTSTTISYTPTSDCTIMQKSAMD